MGPFQVPAGFLRFFIHQLNNSSLRNFFKSICRGSIKINFFVREGLNYLLNFSILLKFVCLNLEVWVQLGKTPEFPFPMSSGTSKTIHLHGRSMAGWVADQVRV